jgi:DNA-directed RNA polymerase subunit N
MIIPVRCFTCGKVLADKWDAYVRRCTEESDGRAAADASGVPPTPGSDGERPGPDGKTARGRILDDLGITSCCCRIAMMSHVDLSLVI